MSTLVTGPFPKPTVLIAGLVPLYGATDTNAGFLLLGHKIETVLKILFKDFRTPSVVFAFTVLIIGRNNSFSLDSYGLKSIVPSIDFLLYRVDCLFRQPLGQDAIEGSGDDSP